MRRLFLFYVSFLVIGLIVSGVVASYILSNANFCKNAFYAYTIYGVQKIKSGQTVTFAFRIFNNAHTSLTLKNIDVNASEGLNIVDICIEDYASRGAPIEGSFPGTIKEDYSLRRLNINGQVVPAGKSVVLAISVNSGTSGNYSINHVHIHYSYLFFTYNQTLPSLSLKGLVPFNIPIIVF